MIKQGFLLMVMTLAVFDSSGKEKLDKNMTHESFVNEAISVTLEQFKLLESFCQENASSLDNDYREQLNRIAGYDVEKKVVLSDDSLKVINKMKEDMTEGLLSEIVEAGASEYFCESTYSKWKKLERADLVVVAERAWAKYNLKTSK